MNGKKAYFIGLLLPLLAHCGEASAPAAEDSATDTPRAAYGAPPAQAAAAPAQSPALSAPSTKPRPAPAPLGTALIEYPDQLQMVMLGYRLRGVEPPLDAWTNREVKVRIANEFEKPALQAAERAKLEEVYATTANVGRLVVKTTSRLAEYDAARGGFYLQALTPGTIFTFKVNFPGTGEDEVTLQIENLDQGYFWPLPRAEAEALMQRVRFGRQVDLHIDLDITGIAGRGKVPTILGQMRGYRIVLDTGFNKGEEVAHVKIAP